MASNDLRRSSIGAKEQESNKSANSNTNHNPSIISHEQQPKAQYQNDPSSAKQKEGRKTYMIKKE